jgi:hypothetical protein
MKILALAFLGAFFGTQATHVTARLVEAWRRRRFEREMVKRWREHHEPQLIIPDPQWFNEAIQREEW